MLNFNIGNTSYRTILKLPAYIFNYSRSYFFVRALRSDILQNATYQNHVKCKFLNQCGHVLFYVLHTFLKIYVFTCQTVKMVWTIKLLIIFGATVTYAGSINSEGQNTANSNVTWNDSTIVVAEGVKIIADSINQLTKSIHNVITSTPSTPNTIVTINETQIANFTSSFNNISSSTITTTTTTAATHKFLYNYSFASTAAPPNSTATSTTTTLKTIPVNEIEVGEKNDNRTSVAKKGFGVNETGELPSSISTTTTTTPKPKKPTVTIGNDDKIDSVGNNATRTITNPNMNLSPVSQKTDYIVPIVGVILSVPLVAILLNLVYRKTKDWWQYRHYKRMDLIDGIYNN